MSPARRPAEDPPGRVRVTRVAGTASGEAAEDELAVEEPLEIRVGERRLVVTMRTPGDDYDLARGLLFTEGLVPGAADVVAVSHCRDVEPQARGNVVTVTLRAGVGLDEARTPRVGVMSASCGVCGKQTLEAVRVAAPRVGPGPRLHRDLLQSLPQALRSRQAVFDRTGGLHGAGLFAADGRLLVVREDVGRHNAVDKVIGDAMRFGRLPLHDTILMISGRAGFEIVQTARRAGIPVLCAVSAPSTLAVDLARDGGQTLVGFLRDDRFNVYAGAERFDPPLG